MTPVLYILIGVIGTLAIGAVIVSLLPYIAKHEGRGVD